MKFAGELAHKLFFKNAVLLDIVMGCQGCRRVLSEDPRFSLPGSGLPSSLSLTVERPRRNRVGSLELHLPKRG